MNVKEAEGDKSRINKEDGRKTENGIKERGRKGSDDELEKRNGSR